MNSAIETILGIQKEIYTNAKNNTGIEQALINTLKEESAQFEKAKEAAKDTPDTRILKQEEQKQTDLSDEKRPSEHSPAQILDQGPVQALQDPDEFVRPNNGKSKLSVQEKMAKLRVSSNIDISQGSAATKSDESGAPTGSTEGGAQGHAKAAKEEDDQIVDKKDDAQIVDKKEVKERVQPFAGNVSHTVEPPKPTQTAGSTRRQIVLSNVEDELDKPSRPQPSAMGRPQPTTAMMPKQEEQAKEVKADQKKTSRADIADNTDQAVDSEDSDPRFRHTLMSEEGPDIDVKRKFFKNTNGSYLMSKVKYLEKHDKDKFFRFIYMGKAMIDYATAGDLENFKRLFQEADDFEVMYWHVSKGFKAAVKAKQLAVVEFVMEELDMPMNNEAFFGYLSAFIFACREAEMEHDDTGKEINRQIVRYMMKGYGKGNIDQMDKANGSTPLIMACEYLTDLIIIETLVDWGGADVNAVNNDDGMPLNIIKKRLKDDPENYELQDIYEYLKRRGAKRDWRKPKAVNQMEQVD